MPAIRLAVAHIWQLPLDVPLKLEFAGSQAMSPAVTMTGSPAVVGSGVGVTVGEPPGVAVGVLAGVFVGVADVPLAGLRATSSPMFEVLVDPAVPTLVPVAPAEESAWSAIADVVCVVVTNQRCVIPAGIVMVVLVVSAAKNNS